MKKHKHYGYLCGVDWQHELGNTSFPELYNSVDELKKYRTCWVQCGIVKVELKLVEWSEPQDFSTIGENDYVDSAKP